MCPNSETLEDEMDEKRSDGTPRVVVILWTAQTDGRFEHKTLRNVRACYARVCLALERRCG